MRKTNKNLTVEDLKAIVNYDPETGIFTSINGNRKRLPGETLGSLNAAGYLTIGIGYWNHYAHRLAWLYMTGEYPKNHIDHINSNRSDNSFSNLRDVTVSINCQNQIKPPSHNTTGLLGVSYSKQYNKYMAQIKLNQKNNFIGFFDTKEDAHNAYIVKKRELHVGCTI